ncbi:MAG: OmpH family outer membrane protein [Burkholderiaceae bacterium]|nr:OmpH family outer membrane protein [Burkholderiaceae bacterium]
MNKIFLALGCSIAIGFCSVSAAAQDYKIGFVNSDRVLREAAPAQAAQQKLEAEFSKRGKELEDIAQRLKNQSDKLEKDGAVMPEAERSKRQREFADADRDFQRKRREYQEDLAQRRNEEVAAVVERANRVIKQIAEQEKYDLILQDAIYFSSKIDITEKVIRALNGSK